MPRSAPPRLTELVNVGLELTNIYQDNQGMPKVISIYDAKTNLSKLVKQAEAGQTIYIGDYGKLQAILAPAPAK